MASRWCQHHRGNVGTKDKLRAILSIEEEEKLMLRMIVHNALERLKRKPTYPLQFIRKEKSGIYSYLHTKSILG